MNFHLKRGVSAVGVRPEMLVGLMIAESVWEGFQIHGGLVVTSLCEERGIHRDGSLHFVGLGADLRTNPDLQGGVPDQMLDLVSNSLTDELGDDWQVIVEEGSHIHIEFQPKKRV